MSKKLRVSAESIPELRDFLAGADVDMGCRPVAVKRGDRYATEVISDDDELARLGRRRAGGVRIEVLEEMPSAARRLRMVPSGNRFAGGVVPRGYGRKE
ncbi:hypothetical protein [Salipiger thiooxidans]|jgi:hypothetical protein|uniref:hypothetical protein n=1 Tax=Salipiger thiooxidans TaxID=282683 RepID=UPI001CD60A87|nr:hypothetical protein [Salipiger thiooxidans]MBR9838485.1 hypothetical protein [Paracoccaceae bacterium]MCA0845735.1 hypothetical protein [Salipiger thiooxidans]